MNTWVKVILFGIISGLTWSLMLGGLNTEEDSIFIFTAGVITGVAVSLVLKAPLTKSGWKQTLVLGLISLPLGSFIFYTLFYFNVELVKDEFSKSPFEPIFLGAYFALMSVLWGFYYFPLSVITTFALRKVIRSGAKSAI
ncbi:MAG TPA: hypothetical protein VIK59_13755 [Verrucomicrobiae bacterium]